MAASLCLVPCSVLSSKDWAVQSVQEYFVGLDTCLRSSFGIVFLQLPVQRPLGPAAFPTPDLTQPIWPLQRQRPGAHGLSPWNTDYGSRAGALRCFRALLGKNDEVEVLSASRRFPLAGSAGH